MIESMTVNKHRFDEELKRGFILATDAADYLVLKGIPFREAHRIVGEVVKYCEEKGKRFNEILLDELRTISNIFDTDIIQTLNSGNVLGKKKTAGSPNPKKVKMEIEKWKEKLII